METPPPQTVAFGLAVRRARKARDLTQEALAGRAGISSKHISEIERANREPGLTTAVKLVMALDLPVEERCALYESVAAAIRQA